LKLIMRQQNIKAQISMNPDALLLTSRFEDALIYAARLHAGQKRKGTNIPYMAHLMSVAALVLEDGGDENEAIGALLQDVVEDQGVLREEIGQRFGEKVKTIVDGCTDADVIPKPPWRERKERYIEHLRHTPPEVRRVSLADKLHNARAILADYRVLGDDLWERFNGRKEGTLWYYRALLEAFQETGSTCMIEEFERVVVELEQLAAR
jgi:(p)ppGpp synthase/HD superfamily hydrolase